MRDGGRDAHTNGHLDPLLRELLDFGVVELDPDEGVWRLSESARVRLGQLAVPHPPTEKIVYFGHRCTSCRQVRPTRLRAPGYLCDECLRSGPVPGWSGELPQAGPLPQAEALRAKAAQTDQLPFGDPLPQAASGLPA